MEGKLENQTFTGNKDVDLLIMESLPDESLGQFCQVNYYARKLCQNDNFWRKRFISRFAEAIPDFETLFSQKQTSWRNYYIYIVNWLENHYKTTKSGGRDEETKQLYAFMKKKSLEYLKCYINEDGGLLRCGKFQDVDLLDPEIIILESVLSGLDDEEYTDEEDEELTKKQRNDKEIRRRYMEMFGYMLEDTRRYIIDKSKFEDIVDFIGDDGVKLLLEKRGTEDIWKLVLDRYFKDYSFWHENVITYIPLDFLNAYIKKNLKLLNKKKLFNLKRAGDEKYGPGKLKFV